MLKQLRGLILIFGLIGNVFGQNVLIQKCWEYEGQNILFPKNASDNDNSFIFFRDNGDIFLDSINKFGKILWSNDVGGIPISNILLSKGKIYVLLKSEQDILIKGLSVETGLVIWQKKLDIVSNNLSSNFQLVNNNNFLLLIENREKILFFDLISGDLLREKQLTGISKTNIIIREGNAFYISQQNKLVKSNLANNFETVLHQFEKEIKQVYFLSQNQVLVVDELNNVICLDLSKKKIDWLVKLGAGVNSISESSDSYLITSIDNYIYCVKKENGKFLWRKRTEGRSEGNLDNLKTIYISSLINGQTTLFSELKKGKTLNQVFLAENEFFVGEPLIFGNQFILQTNVGFKSYSFNSCN